MEGNEKEETKRGGNHRLRKMAQGFYTVFLRLDVADASRP